MKLRTRLFLWVGIIFFLAFGASLIFEIYSTDKNLNEAEESLRQDIMMLNEKKRSHIEEFLHVSLTEEQALIDSLLLRVARNPDLGAKLFLDARYVDLASASHSSFLFKNNRWIDLIQSTKNNELTSLLVPIDFPMDVSYNIPIDDRISWVVIEHDKEYQRPYIGVKLPTLTGEKKVLSLAIDELVEKDWGIVIFFDPIGLLNFTTRKVEGPHETYGVDYAAFVKAIEHASQYLKSLKEKDPSKEWIRKDIAEKGKDLSFKEKPLDLGITCIAQEGYALNNRIIQLLQRGDQAILLSVLASLFPGGEFGSNLFAQDAPKGITRFAKGERVGHSILTAESFYKKRVFDDAAYIKAHPSTKECKGMGSSVAVIAPENMQRIFIGNSLEMKGETGSGYLTIAVDTDQVVQDLVLAVHKVAFLVHGNQVINAFEPDGTKIPDLKAIPFHEKMLKSRNGIVKWRGENYYFEQIIPFKGLDLHFFTLESEKSAFTLVRALREGSKEVLKKVSFNMRAIAVIALALVLILLHNVAKKITKPIASLARVTKDVASGRLEDIELPQAPKGRKDEVAVLCNSFSQMVSGLKEKEKVKGILNKVVSTEIAEEIMKGQIHLGGEERKVTVLFADIRNFTRLSASMEPKKVIEMLNACMTKISHVIDEFGGVIDKYVGDEVMALFGAPLEKKESALKAVQSALKMVEVLKAWNVERNQRGEENVEMGIGIHTGVVLAGNMGAENRLNYTVIGSDVNLAARLCSAAKRMEVLISKATLSEPDVAEYIEVEELPPTELKGFEESFILYRVKGVKGK